MSRVQNWRSCKTQSLDLSSGSRRVLRAHPNGESRHVGDTDHKTKLETGTASTEPKGVRSPETVGGRKRTKDSGSKIRDAACRAATGTGRKPGKVR